MAWTCQRRPAQGAAAIDFGKTIAATDSAALARRQPSPIERHVPLPDDKVVLAELVRAHCLVGIWQGPGCIAEMRRWS
jgi:hypothetical protein